MEVIKIMGVTFVIVVPMILGCTFLFGKSKNFIDKLSGKDDKDKSGTLKKHDS